MRPRYSGIRGLILCLTVYGLYDTPAFNDANQYYYDRRDKK